MIFILNKFSQNNLTIIFIMKNKHTHSKKRKVSSIIGTICSRFNFIPRQGSLLLSCEWVIIRHFYIWFGQGISHTLSTKETRLYAYRHASPCDWEQPSIQEPDSYRFSFSFPYFGSTAYFHELDQFPTKYLVWNPNTELFFIKF